MRKQEFNSKLISLLPLDEVPVHVPLRRPRPLRFERLRVSVESIQPRPPQPCEVGRPKGRRRKNRRNLTVFFKAPTPGRATAWLAQPITADHVKQAASPTRQEHHAQGLKHLSSDRLPQRRMLALRFHRGQLRISQWGQWGSPQDRRRRVTSNRRPLPCQFRSPTPKNLWLRCFSDSYNPKNRPKQAGFVDELLTSSRGGPRMAWISEFRVVGRTEFRTVQKCPAKDFDTLQSERGAYVVS